MAEVLGEARRLNEELDEAQERSRELEREVDKLSLVPENVVERWSEK